MIQVNLPRLCEGYSGLRQTARSLSAQLQAARSVGNGLHGSELEKFRPVLNEVLNAGEEQYRELLRMVQALDTACQYYSACENWIVDRCENAAISYPARRAEFVRLADTANTLRDMGFL